MTRRPLYISFLAKFELRQRKLADRSSPYYSSHMINSMDLKYPPTAVGGIKSVSGDAFIERT
jgi:hypothetical protein